MLSLSLPRLASLAPTSATSRRRRFLQRRRLSVSLSPATRTPCIPLSKRFRLAAKPDSIELEEFESGEFEDREEEGTGEQESGMLQVFVDFIPSTI